jgi:hypothetical protein
MVFASLYFLFFVFCYLHFLAVPTKFMDCVLLEFVVALKVLMCSCGTQVILGAFGVFFGMWEVLHGSWRWFLYNTHLDVRPLSLFDMFITIGRGLGT